MKSKLYRSLKHQIFMPDFCRAIQFEVHSDFSLFLTIIIFISMNFLPCITTENLICRCFFIASYLPA